jgi:hypothetical protein
MWRCGGEIVMEIERREELEKREEEDEDEDEVCRILGKAVVTRDLNLVLNDEENWRLIILLDFYEFSKIFMEIPKECLDKQKLKEFIESFRAREP